MIYIYLYVHVFVFLMVIAIIIVKIMTVCAEYATIYDDFDEMGNVDDHSRLDRGSGENVI